MKKAKIVFVSALLSTVLLLGCNTSKSSSQSFEASSSSEPDRAGVTITNGSSSNNSSSNSSSIASSSASSSSRGGNTSSSSNGGNTTSNSGNSSSNNQGGGQAGPVVSTKTYRESVDSLADKIEEVPESKDLLGETKSAKALRQLGSKRNLAPNAFTEKDFTEPSIYYQNWNQFEHYCGSLYDYYDYCVTCAKYMKRDCLLNCNYLNKWIVHSGESLKLSYDPNRNVLVGERINGVEAYIDGVMHYGKSYEIATFSYDTNNKAVIDYECFMPRFIDYESNMTYYFSIHYVEDDYVKAEDYRYSCNRGDGDQLRSYSLYNNTAFVDLKEDFNITSIEARCEQDPNTYELIQNESTSLYTINRIQKVGDYVAVHQFISGTSLSERFYLYNTDGKRLAFSYDNNIAYLYFNLYELVDGWDKFHVSYGDGFVESASLYRDEIMVTDNVSEGASMWCQVDERVANINGVGSLYFVEEPFIFTPHANYQDNLAAKGLSLIDGFDIDDIYTSSLAKTLTYDIEGISFNLIKSMNTDLYNLFLFHPVLDHTSAIEQALAVEGEPVSFDSFIAQVVTSDCDSNFTLRTSGDDKIIDVAVDNIVSTDSTKHVFNDIGDIDGELYLLSGNNYRVRIGNSSGTYNNGSVTFNKIESSINLFDLSNGYYHLSLEVASGGKVFDCVDLPIEKTLITTPLIESNYTIIDETGVCIEETKTITITDAGAIKVIASYEELTEYNESELDPAHVTHIVAE